jgi:hypothetical protein
VSRAAALRAAILHVLVHLLDELLPSRRVPAAIPDGLARCAPSPRPPRPRHSRRAVYALYGRSQAIFRVLAWAFAAEHVTIILFTTLTVHKIHWIGLCAPDHISTASIGIGCAPHPVHAPAHRR